VLRILFGLEKGKVVGNVELRAENLVDSEIKEVTIGRTWDEMGKIRNALRILVG
jgi:hypothetical protein